MKSTIFFFTFSIFFYVGNIEHSPLYAQPESHTEADYYPITRILIPEGVVLEASALAFNDKDQLAVTTRRGEVWIISNPDSSNPTFKLFGQGLHEPLGIAYRSDAYYIAQRGELIRLEDQDNDGRADIYKTIYRWPLTGNYHEYSYGPLFLPDGDMIVTLNLSWIGYGASLTDWRGWMLKITEDGDMTPIATGLRSPVGIGLNADGDLFYTENQGDWIGSGWMTHLEPGDFAGHPEGLRWTQKLESPLDLRFEDIDDSDGLTLYEQSKHIPEIKNPAVWFPHTIMGISTSGILLIENDDQVGPYSGQMLVSDQGHSKIMRVALEKVQGEYQGAVFGFREGFSSGIIKFEWGPDDEIYTAMTNRGWGSTGREPFGIDRMSWTGELPFEMHSIQAESNGFTIHFTKPLDYDSALNIDNLKVTDFTYNYDSSYGSPVRDRQDKAIIGLEIAENKKSVRLFVEGLRQGYIYEVRAEGVRSQDGSSLLHSVGYYTLNNLPDGKRSTIVTGETEEEREDEVERNAKKITEIPDEWVDGPDNVVELSTKPGLQYNRDIITVKAGSKIAFTFNNNDDMAHNVVIAEPETADVVGEAAMNLGLGASAMEFVPRMDEVLFHTSMLEPGQIETIYIKVPVTPGDYPFICTFPGHHISMRGVLRVK